jgi:hypothetical protein
MTRAHAFRYLTHDARTGEYTGGLRVPCSRYGRTEQDCAPWAYLAAVLVCREAGAELETHDLDYAMGLAVNDYDDILYAVTQYANDDDLAALFGSAPLGREALAEMNTPLGERYEAACATAARLYAEGKDTTEADQLCDVLQGMLGRATH